MHQQVSAKSPQGQADAPGQDPASAMLAPASQSASAEGKFRSLLESAPDAIIIVDTTGCISIVNTQAERLFGYDRSELIGQPIEILVPTRYHHVHMRHRSGYVASPHMRPMGAGLALSGRHKDGTEFPAEISLSPLQTEDGLLITSVIRDVTDRRRAAEELERQVQRRTAHLNALLKFSSQLLGARSLDVVLQHASTHAMKLVPEAQRGAIYLYDPKGDRLVLRASTGFSRLPQISRPAGMGLLGRAFMARHSLLIHSVEEFRAVMADGADD